MFSQDAATSPIDPARLASALAPHGRSTLLPREAYVDPGVFAWEQAHFFTGWVCLGRSTDLAEVGSQRAVSLGVAGVLLTRAEDGVLRAFANVCRHRGHELLPCGSGARKKGIVCPYHAWSYRLDGSLLGAPGFRDVEGFDPGPLGLIELPSQEWHGWVFVDGSGRAGPFADHIGELEGIVAPYRPATLQVLASHEYEIAANWKTVVENYQECYHCSMIHPELCAVSPPDSGSNLDMDGDWVGGWMSLRDEADTMSLDGRSARRGDPGALGDRAAHGDVRRAVPQPAGQPAPGLRHDPPADAARGRPHGDRVRVAVPRGGRAAAGFDPAYAVDFWDLTNRQDWAACESVQRGLSSEHARPGPLAPEEDGVQQFVAMVANGYLGQDARKTVSPAR